jgi:hypothetical protein
VSALVRRDDHGVLLNYGDPGELRDFHHDTTPKASDRERVLCVRAERALRLVSTIIECLNLDDALVDRAIDVIHSALDVGRARLGIAPPGARS